MTNPRDYRDARRGDIAPVPPSSGGTVVQRYVGDTCALQYALTDTTGAPVDITASTMRLEIRLGLRIVLGLPENLSAGLDRTQGLFAFTFATCDDVNPRPTDMGAVLVVGTRGASAATQRLYELRVVQVDSQGNVSTAGLEQLQMNFVIGGVAPSWNCGCESAAAAPVTGATIIGGAVLPPARTLVTGVQGPAGVPGNIAWVVAAESLPPHVIVRVAASGGVVAASADSSADLPYVVGMTQAAAAVGAAVPISSAGVVTDAAWTWTSGPVYLGLDGAPTQIVPEGGFALQIGVAPNPTSIALRIVDSGAGNAQTLVLQDVFGNPLGRILAPLV